MDTVTRRRFLLASGVTAAGALAAGGTALAVREVLGTAGSAAPDAKTLVLLTLYGGNDGLGTLVPYADAAYRAARPEFAYDAGRVLKLDNSLGLNPSLKGLKRVWDAGQLAIVRGVGYPKHNRSHFASMDIWQTASPDRPIRTGWVGRWLDATGGGPLHAISFEPVLPPALAGARTAGGSVRLAGSRVPAAGAARDALAALGKSAPGETPAQARAAAAFTDLLAVDSMVRNLPSPSPTADDDHFDDEVKANGASAGGQTALDKQLAMVARCVEAGVATRVFSVSLGGFDLHADEKASQERLLGELDSAVSTFLSRMASSPRGRGVVVLVYSEFGRRVKANASDGTDHGTSGPMFLAGAPVKGGFFGTQPSLTDLDAGDLRMHVDFRDVYASVLAGVLDADPGPILADHKGRLPNLFRV